MVCAVRNSLLQFAQKNVREGAGGDLNAPNLLNYSECSHVLGLSVKIYLFSLRDMDTNLTEVLTSQMR